MLCIVLGSLIGTVSDIEGFAKIDLVETSTCLFLTASMTLNDTGALCHHTLDIQIPCIYRIVRELDLRLITMQVGISDRVRSSKCLIRSSTLEWANLVVLVLLYDGGE